MTDLYIATHPSILHVNLLVVTNDRKSNIVNIIPRIGEKDMVAKSYSKIKKKRNQRVPAYLVHIYKISGHEL